MTAAITKEPITRPSIDSNILQLLHKDHQKVAELFFQYTNLESDKDKQECVAEIIKELTIHAQVEEEIVYPAVRDDVEDSEDMMDEADTEHHMVKLLMAELAEMKPSDDHFDSKVTVLCELVKHHVQEEEKEMFEEIRDSNADLKELAVEVLARKAELMEALPTARKAPIKTSSRGRGRKSK
ncbi:MAG: hemerythrin domain-containing protein [Candidatus Obscuribacterales bacterium]|nr:hemerythrin domain-containing protein [Candidatus Obscuribacterales bacterium]